MSLVREACRVATIRGLNLQGVSLSDDDLAFLADSCPDLDVLVLRSPETMPLDELDDLTSEEKTILESRRPSGDGLKAISRFKKLKTLVLDGYPLPPDRLQFLSGAIELDTLVLWNTGVMDDDLRPLGAVPLKVLELKEKLINGSGLRYLRHDSLTGVGLYGTAAADDFAHVFSDKQWPRLKALRVYDCKISEAGMQSLRQTISFVPVSTGNRGSYKAAPPLGTGPQAIRGFRAACEQFCFGEGELLFDGESLAGVLVRAKREHDDWALSNLALMTNLKVVIMAGCRISSASLARLHPLTELEALDLKGTQIDDAGVQHIARFIRLKRLGLEATAVTNAGLQQLSQLAELEKLVLDDTRVTEQGLSVLPNLPRLREFSLRNCLVTDEGAQHLLKVKGLRRLILDKTDFSERVAEQLLEHLRRNRQGAEATEGVQTQ